MKVERIIAETKFRYSQLHSYTDEGCFSQDRCGRKFRQTFRTAFLKPGKLLFESNLLKPDEPEYALLGDVGIRLIVGGVTCELRYRHVSEPTKSKEAALFAASAFPPSNMNLVIPLLMPELELESIIDEDLILIPELDVEECYHLWCRSGQFHIWVRKEDFIIKCFKREFNRSSLKDASEKALEAPGDVLGRYERIQCDTPVAEATFSFDDFVQKTIASELIMQLLKSAYAIS